MPDNIYNFLLWVRKNTHHLQNNVVRYKNVMYFTDRRTEPAIDEGGLDDLWAIYVKEVVG